LKGRSQRTPAPVAGEARKGAGRFSR
jgi:hypothetical protein